MEDEPRHEVTESEKNMIERCSSDQTIVKIFKICHAAMHTRMFRGTYVPLIIVTIDWMTQIFSKSIFFALSTNKDFWFLFVVIGRNL